MNREHENCTESGEAVGWPDGRTAITELGKLLLFGLVPLVAVAAAQEAIESRVATNVEFLVLAGIMGIAGYGLHRGIKIVERGRDE